MATVESTQERLRSARELIFQVERSPSAYLPELRAKLEQARKIVQAVLNEFPREPEAMRLLASIDSLLAQLAPRQRPEHPTEAQAAEALERLEGLVKGDGPRGEVEAVHTRLRKLIPRVKAEVGGVARLYEARAKFLWEEYSRSLTTVRDLCPECPALELVTVTDGFERARLLGAGDYALDDIEAMQSQDYTPLLTGDFNKDGAMDAALIGRGERQKTSGIFLLIASIEKGQGYRRLFLKALNSKRAALALQNGEIVLRENVEAGVNFWTVAWNGKTFDIRRSKRAMGKR